MIERWSKPNGYRNVLAICLPLVASMGSITIMQFTDRIFLARYSVDAIAAALPAGIASFTFLCFFFGVAGYTNTFVAQYAGAKAYDRIGAAIWQGVYFSFFSGIILASLFFISGPLFDLIGHSPRIRAMEKTYFNILTLGAGILVLNAALASFYTGRGLTRVVMFANIIGATINIPLDYCLIYGVGPFPELGITGAAIATVSAAFLVVLIFAGLVLAPANRSRFGTWKNKRFDRELFGRLMRFGLPSGAQIFLEVFGFTFFIQMVGRIGDMELAASNIVLALENLAFLPMVGFHISAAILVGQAIGHKCPEEGVYATTSTLHIALVYMTLIAALLVILPEPVLRLFKSHQYTPEQFADILKLGLILVKFVVLFCFFDVLNLVYSGAIKGAGDTRFIMGTVAVISFGVMILPVYVSIEILGAGMYTAWALVTSYAAALGVAFMLRYKQGKWKIMRVIENPPA